MGRVNRNRRMNRPCSVSQPRTGWLLSSAWILQISDVDLRGYRRADVESDRGMDRGEHWFAPTPTIRDGFDPPAELEIWKQYASRMQVEP